MLALILLPAPLLPPHRLAQIVQRDLGVGWERAYLTAAVDLQRLFWSMESLTVTALLRSLSNQRTTRLAESLSPSILGASGGMASTWLV